MLPKDCSFNCCCAYFFLWILNDALKVQGSHLKCCFNVLKNDSVSYQLSESPGPSCTTTWSAMGVVVVDENGNVDQNMVAYHEPSKIILNMAKQVTYRQDCLSSRNSYKGTCNDPCAAVDVPIEATPQPTQKLPIIIPIGIPIVLIIIIIIVMVICCKRKHFIKSYFQVNKNASNTQLETQPQV